MLATPLQTPNNVGDNELEYLRLSWCFGRLFEMLLKLSVGHTSVMRNTGHLGELKYGYDTCIKFNVMLKSLSALKMCLTTP